MDDLQTRIRAKFTFDMFMQVLAAHAEYRFYNRTAMLAAWERFKAGQRDACELFVHAQLATVDRATGDFTIAFF